MQKQKILGCMAILALAVVAGAVRTRTARAQAPAIIGGPGHSATRLSDGTVLLAGGYDRATGLAIRSAQVYDFRTGALARVADMTSPRSGHTATRLPDGKVAIAGGDDGSGALAS